MSPRSEWEWDYDPALDDRLLEREDMRRAEQHRNQRPRYDCGDGYCGADDCCRCHPTTWWHGDEEE